MTRTAANKDWKHVSGESDIWPVWKASDPLTSIRPIITEEAYLEQQHLLVMLKSQEGDEPYGKWRIVRVCIISIVNYVNKGNNVGEMMQYFWLLLCVYMRGEGRGGGGEGVGFLFFVQLG